MTYAAIDCMNPLNATSAKALAAQGITHVIRYLDSGLKGLTADEVKAISDAGLKIVSVYETNPTQASYFTNSQGKFDGVQASKLAKLLGQPSGSSIYFTVDYDAQGRDLGAILDYFSGVIGAIDSSFKVGAYGSYSVLQYLKQHSKVDYYFQTIAWSYGQVCEFAHLYQYQENVTLAGVNVDRDKVISEPGAWKLATKPVAKHTPKLTSHQTTYTVKSGDNLTAIANKFNITVDELVKLNCISDPDVIQLGQVLKIVAPKEVYHTVVSGESLSVIASNNGLNLAQIEALNPQIKQPDLIQLGEKVRIK